MPGQGKTEQRPHKVSFTLAVKGQQAAEVISALDGDLKAAGLSAKVIYSGGEDLDILPQQASKGKGLEFLLEQVASPISYRAVRARILHLYTGRAALWWHTDSSAITSKL